MDVIHALAWYFPESTGGTEVYVAGLVNELATLGVAGTIAVPHSAAHSLDDAHAGVSVHRYPFAPAANPAATRGEGPPLDFDAFVAWLERRPRGIYHQHSWTTSCGLAHLRVAKQLGFKTVLSVHLAGNICLRGTMMEFGNEPCDGEVEPKRCAACWAHARGLPRRAAEILAELPQFVSGTANRGGARNRLVTALGACELAAARKRQIAAMAEAADRIVAVCAWLKDALARNGICGEKVVLSRQGVGREFFRRPREQRQRTEQFRLGFLGRCDPVKGLPVLIAAVERLPPDIPLRLVIHARANTDEDRRRRDALAAKTAGDPRISFMPPVERAELPAVLASFDVLAVPSQWMETGPLVVLEAQAAGVPVLGSDLGGIAELVSRGRDGHLVAFADVGAWADAIRQAVEGTLPGLEKTPARRAVRTMADAARDMAALYASIA